MHLQEEEIKSLFETFSVSILNRNKAEMAAFNFNTFKAAVDKASEISYLKGKLDCLSDVKNDIASLKTELLSL